jgi:hypothetical protein
MATTMAVTTTMARARAAAVAAVATVAAAGAAAVATMPAMATVATTVAIAAAVAAAEKSGRGLVLTAHKGDTNQREENRDTQNNNAVHPRILQFFLQVP